MTLAQRSEPVFFVRVKPPPQKKAPAPVTMTKRLKDATAALARARAALQSFMATTQGGPAVIETNDDGRGEVRGYILVRGQVRRAEEAYAAALADARKRTKPPVVEPPASAPELTSSVLSFEYEEDEKKADQLTLTLRNDDLSYFDSPLFEKGTMLLVGWGYVGALSPTREVIVQKVTGARTLKVVAQSKGVLMNKETRVRTFERKTRSEIVRQIAAECGYGTALQDITETTVRHGVLSQAAMTDAQFLKKLADQEGFEFFVDFDGLHWHPRRLKQKPVRVLTYYLPPDVGDIKDFNVENDVTAKPGSVNVKGRDPLTKKAIDAKADNASTKRGTLAPVVEVVGGDQPHRARAINLRTGAATRKMKASAASETRQTSETDAASAKAEADAIFRRTQITAVQLTLDLVGDPYLVAKTVVEVRGLGKRLSGKYYIAGLKHTLGSGGYSLSAKAKTDGTQTGSAAAKSKGTPNKTEPDKTTAPGALTPRRVVDTQTGERRTVFKDTRGRSATG